MKIEDVVSNLGIDAIILYLFHNKGTGAGCSGNHSRSVERDIYTKAGIKIVDTPGHAKLLCMYSDPSMKSTVLPRWCKIVEDALLTVKTHLEAKELYNDTPSDPLDKTLNNRVMSRWEELSRLAIATIDTHAKAEQLYWEIPHTMHHELALRRDTF